MSITVLCQDVQYLPIIQSTWSESTDVPRCIEPRSPRFRLALRLRLLACLDALVHTYVYQPCPDFYVAVSELAFSKKKHDWKLRVSQSEVWQELTF